MPAKRDHFKGRHGEFRDGVRVGPPHMLSALVERSVYDEQPAKVFFAEAVMGALDEYVDAKMEYAASRRDPVTAEYANPDPVYKAAERLQTLLGKVRFAL